jgi:hypothetical protein
LGAISSLAEGEYGVDVLTTVDMDYETVSQYAVTVSLADENHEVFSTFEVNVVNEDDELPTDILLNAPACDDYTGSVSGIYCSNRDESDYLSGNDNICTCRARCDADDACMGINYYTPCCAGWDGLTEDTALCFLIFEDTCTEVTSSYDPIYEWKPEAEATTCEEVVAFTPVAEGDCDGPSQAPGDGGCNEQCSSAALGSYYRGDLGGCVGADAYCACPTDAACSDSWFGSQCADECAAAAPEAASPEAVYATYSGYWQEMGDMIGESTWSDPNSDAFTTEFVTDSRGLPQQIYIEMNGFVTDTYTVKQDGAGYEYPNNGAANCGDYNSNCNAVSLELEPTNSSSDPLYLVFARQGAGVCITNRVDRTSSMFTCDGDNGQTCEQGMFDSCAGECALSCNSCGSSTSTFVDGNGEMHCGDTVLTTVHFTY